MDSHSKWLIAIVLAGVLGIGVVAVYWCASEKQAESADREEAMTELASRHGAARDWSKVFDEERVVLEQGHRDVYTEDVENAVLRRDGKPLLVVGYIFEARKVDEEHFLGVRTYDGPDINFILKCSAGLFKKVMNQPTDDGEFFAVVARATVVKRPAFEVDAYVFDSDDDPEAAVLVEPGDVYIVTGTCLDLLYIGEHE